MTPPRSNLKLQATVRTRVPTRPRTARRAVRTQISNAQSTKPLLGGLIEAALPNPHSPALRSSFGVPSDAGLVFIFSPNPISHILFTGP